MTSRDFCYWLQGFFELGDDKNVVTPQQIHIIRAHLDMVFKHEIDPSHGDAKHQAVLSQAHAGGGASGVGFHKPPRARC